MIPADFEAVEGDELPAFEHTLTEDDNETRVDLTGATVVFRMRSRDESAAAIVATATPVVPETEGRFTFAIIGPAGVYNAEFVVTDAGNERTFPRDRPLRVVIRPRV